MVRKRRTGTTRKPRAAKADVVKNSRTSRFEAHLYVYDAKRHVVKFKRVVASTRATLKERLDVELKLAKLNKRATVAEIKYENWSKGSLESSSDKKRIRLRSDLTNPLNRVRVRCVIAIGIFSTDVYPRRDASCSVPHLA